MPTTRARIVSIQVGLPKDLGMAGAGDPLERPWTSGIFKAPVVGPVLVGTLNIEGDGQADPVNHGGPDKAVLAYSADHYPAWQSELRIVELGPGGFGENLTVQGVTEQDVCIGDVWRAGDVAFQVSQPRQPCWKLARRWKLSDLPKRVIQTGRSGWYLRVLNEGTLRAGTQLSLESRPQPHWSVARVAAALYDKRIDQATAAMLATLPELSGSWRGEFELKT